VFKIAFKNFLHFAYEQLQAANDPDSANKRSGDSADRVAASVLTALAESFNFVSQWKDPADVEYY
jgi:hypothetical protein